MLYKVLKGWMLMDTVLKFDKVILTKELNDKFKKVGEVFEIANILSADDSVNVNNNSFLLRDSKTRVAIGVVSLEDYEKCFVKEKEFSGWTAWTPLTGYDGQTDALYRTNRRKVQVKFLTDKVRAESCCCKEDDFKLFFGVQMAYLRCLNKALLNRKETVEKELKDINSEIAENNQIIKKMISSLEN